MDDDFISTLGLAVIAHRFRRASELFFEGASAFLLRHGFEAPPRTASTLLLLRARGPLGITEVAHLLRLSHPLINRFAAALAMQGLVSEEEDPHDQRRRLIMLTKAGKVQADLLAELTNVATATFRDLCDEIGIDLLEALDRLEKAAAARSIEERLNDRMRMPSAGPAGRPRARTAATPQKGR